MKLDLWETNNKNERPGLPPATPASQQHRCPLTSSFNVDLKLEALLKSEGGVPLRLEQRCASNQACQTESFESRKPVSAKSRRNYEGQKQAFRECQAEEGQNVSWFWERAISRQTAFPATSPQARTTFPSAYDGKWKWEEEAVVRDPGLCRHRGLVTA